MKKTLTWKAKLQIILTVLRVPLWSVITLRFKPEEGDSLQIGNLIATWKNLEIKVGKKDEEET